MNWRKKDRGGRVVVWCKTQEEVDDFFDVAESEGVTWSGGDYQHLRDLTDANRPNTLFYIYPDNTLCYAPNTCRSTNHTVLGSELHNYAISVRLKRGGTRD